MTATGGIATFEPGGRLVRGEPELLALIGLRPDATPDEAMARMSVLGIGRIGGRGGDLRWRRIDFPETGGWWMILVELDQPGPEAPDLPSRICHVLRTPLSGMRGTLENLADGICGPLPSGASAAVGHLLRQTLRMERVVEDLLASLERAGARA